MTPTNEQIAETLEALRPGALVESDPMGPCKFELYRAYYNHHSPPMTKPVRIQLRDL